MSPLSRYEYLNQIKERYQKSSKSEKQSMLDEFCQVCHYHRKYAIRLLNSDSATTTIANLSKRGRKKQYNHTLILEIIKDIWIKTNLPCSKRLKAIIPLWLPYYEYPLDESTQQKVAQISAATIDRLMRPYRDKFNKKGLATTKPGSILKKQITIKTNQWDETNPGFVEADTVAHCGSSTQGMFVYTVNCVDIATSWTEQRAVWGKGEYDVIKAITSMEAHFPFELKGFDCDNGSEFLNWHLHRYLSNRNKPVQFTRSRPYHKNDNAHVEGKNWTHIRQYLGYQRFDEQQLVDMLNDLYLSEWNLYFNFFMPSVKLIEKYRDRSKIIKKYDKPKTPYQRIMECPAIPDMTKNKLTEQFTTLDPFKLQVTMSNKIKAIINKVNGG